MLGAGLFAANLSTTFRLRKFGMKDGITYPITIEVFHPVSVQICAQGICMLSLSHTNSLVGLAASRQVEAMHALRVAVRKSMRA